MAARYRKIDPRLWKDENFQRLNATEKLIAVYCLTGQSNRIGLFNFSPALAIEDLGLSNQTFREGFDRVSNGLSWRWDKAARVLYIPTWWKYNTPENPNVLKNCLLDLHEIPKTPLLREFADNLKHLPPTFHQPFSEISETFAKGLGERYPHQEQEQEQEQDTPNPPRGLASGFEDFWKAYPRRIGKRAAEKAWERAEGKPPLEQILAAIAKQKQSEQWTKEGGRFIPHPTTWINQGRWDDGIVPEPAKGFVI
jgi:hypothetical protein